MPKKSNKKKLEDLQLYPDKPAYADGFGPESRFDQLLKTSVPPQAMGVLSLLTAFLFIAVLFPLLLPQPQETDRGTTYIQTAQVQTTKQTQIVAGGAPIKWTKLIKQEDVTPTQHTVKLPKDAKNIQIQTLTEEQTQTQEIKLTLAEKNQLAIANQPKGGMFFASILNSISKSLFASIKDAVDKSDNKDKDKIKKEKDAVVVDLAEEIITPEEVVTPITEVEPVAEVISEETLNEELPVEVPVEPITSQLEAESSQEVVAVTYETPAPTITEQATDTGKVVTINSNSESACEHLNPNKTSFIDAITNAPASLFNAVKQLFSLILRSLNEAGASLLDALPRGSNDQFDSTSGVDESATVEPAPEPAGDASLEPESSNLEAETAYQDCLATQAQLTDVLASTKIPEIYKVGQESKIKIKWTNNDDKDVTFHAYDTDNNGKLDYVEWTVPHLSEQIFEIIFISKAWHLDSNKDLVEDIYDTVATQDNVFATIPQNEFVRVTFNDILDDTKDITITAKPAEDGLPSIQIYPVYTDDDGNTTTGPLVATIDNINSLNTYRVLLTDLQTPTDTFDLKVISNGGPTPVSSLDIDYIVDPTAWLTGWAHRKKITIDSTNVDADLSNFPLLVKVTADADLAKALATGYDIRFTDSGGRSTLYYERESWTGGGGAAATGVFWVKVATIDDAVDTELYMYYGKSDAPDGQDPTNVWDSNFAGVWHMNETAVDEATTADLHLDSTSNNNDGDQTGNTNATGQIANAQSFDKIDDYIDFDSFTPDANTISFWININSPENGAIIYGGDDAYASSAWDWSAFFVSGYLFFRGDPGNGGADISYSTSQWIHYVMVRSNEGNFQVYKDGVNVYNNPTYSSSTETVGRYLRIGKSGSEYFDGSIDEVKISNTARSADWIKFEYNNQGNADNELAFSTEEDNVVWLSGWNYRKKITIDHTKVGAGTENQTNFPVLISLSGLSSIKADGADIRFTASDGGTYLAREIESYSAGTLTAWVKVPVLSYQYDTVIYMYYGNSSATEPAVDSTYGSQNVWDSNFKAVYHMNSLTADSTSNANTGTNNGVITGAGKIGGAANFDGTDYETLPIAKPSMPITIEYWTKPTAAGSYGVYDSAPGSANVLRNFPQNTFEWWPSSPTISPDIAGDQWTHISVVYSYDGTRHLTFYKNGASLGTLDGSDSSVFEWTTFTLGSINGAPAYAGLLDDFRVSSTARSAGWIATEYANQNSPGTFYSVEDDNTASTEIVWTNGTGDNLWSTAGNWQGGVVPTSADTAVFNSTASGNCTLDTDVNVYGFQINSDYTGTITQTTHSFTIGVGGYTQNGGTLTHADNSTAETYKLNMTVNGDFDLGASATINVDGLGYDAGYGPGKPISGNTGGSYGGIGAPLPGGTPGPTYGSLTAPVNLGSGGSNNPGGGAIILSVSGTSIISGTISANGGGSSPWRTGSGGSVYLTTGTISGSGTITANSGGSQETTGGGGRVAVILTSGNDFGSVTTTAYAGTANSYQGAAGTVYKQTTAQGAGGGDLIIDNNNISTASGVVTEITSSVTGTTVGTTTLQNKGYLTNDSGQDLIAGGLVVNTGTTLVNNGTIIMTGPTYTINGTLTNNGTIRAYDVTNPTIDYAYGTPTNNEVKNSTSASVIIDSADNNTTHSVTNNWNDSLVGWWRMNGDLTDSSGNANHGTNNGATYTAAGHLGGAYIFDGTSDYVIKTNPTINIDTGSFTTSMWAYPTSSGGRQMLMFVGTGGQAFYIEWDRTDEKFSSEWWGGSGGVVSDTTYSLNAWHHIANVYNGTNSSLYIDGVLAATPASYNLSNIPNDYIEISGYSNGGLPFAGKIDDVQIYNRALSADEIASLYDASASQYSHEFTGLADASTNTFQSFAQDLAGNVTSTTARTFTVDTTAPNASSALSWQESSPVRSTTLNASWTVSNSADLANQKIQFYTGDNCDTTSGSLIDLASTSTNTYEFTGSDLTTYTYKVTSIDTATNETVSACSSAVSILLNVEPNVPVLVSPANASYTNDTTPTLSANYSDNDAGDTGTTNYRISTSSTADCIANTNVIAWGTSSATTDENENTTYTVSEAQKLSQDGTYYWCAQNNDGTAQSAWTAMGSFVLDTSAPIPGQAIQLPVAQQPIQILTEAPQNIIERVRNILDQIASLNARNDGRNEGSRIVYPPIEQSVPEEPQMVFQGGNIIPKKLFDQVSILPLPKSIKDLAMKFPQFASTLEKVGIEKAEDIERLQIAKLVFPSLSEVVGESQGLAFAKFTEEQKAKVPSNIVFARTGNDNIDFNINVKVSEVGEPIQSIAVIQNKPLHLTVKPDYPAESVKGYILLKPNSALSLADSAKASVMEASSITEKKDMVLEEFDYVDKGGIWTASIMSPVVDGQYEIRSVINYEEKKKESETLSMVLVVDPEGYVYEKTLAGRETRIDNAVISIYWLNLDSKNYELWPAKDFQQTNPQITDKTGKYSFLVPTGEYYITAKADGYVEYKSNNFKVEQGAGVHMNIELSPKNWIAKIFSAQNILILIGLVIIILLAYLIIKTKWIKQK